VGLINRLEEKKMVERIPNPNDSRSSYIKLTGKACEFLQKNRKYNVEMDHETVKGFSDDEIKLLRSFLDRIYLNIEKF
jgi:DNA-binding MarR family transcriptional regulator